MLERLTNTPQHLTRSSSQSLQCETDAGKQSNRSFGCCACKQPALICYIFPPGGPRGDQWLSRCLSSCLWENGKSTVGRSGPGSELLHQAAQVLVSRGDGEQRTRGDVLHFIQREQGAGRRWGGRDKVQRCRSVCLCVREVCECVDKPLVWAYSAWLSWL